MCLDFSLVRTCFDMFEDVLMHLDTFRLRILRSDILKYDFDRIFLLRNLFRDDVINLFSDRIRCDNIDFRVNFRYSSADCVLNWCQIKFQTDESSETEVISSSLQTGFGRPLRGLRQRTMKQRMKLKDGASEWTWGCGNYSSTESDACKMVIFFGDLRFSPNLRFFFGVQTSR